jgi:hypothetical protein
LVAPAVDLSVVGLLLGIRHLALHDGPPGVLRSARRLLLFSSAVTLALNVAEPLIAGQYGKAAFDAVGPLLLIGWSEVGPGLLQAMQAVGASAPSVSNPPRAGVDVLVGGRPVGLAPAGVTAPERRRRAERQAQGQDLLLRARAEDALHWQQHRRPISAESLRKRLHIGAAVSRSLVAQLRTDTNSKIDHQAEPVVSGAQSVTA